MTPIGIKILLHYWCSPDQFRDGDFSPPVVSELLSDFVDAGLLKGNPRDGYEPTEALGVYVEAVCSVPLPMQQWIIPWESMDGN